MATLEHTGVGSPGDVTPAGPASRGWYPRAHDAPAQPAAPYLTQLYFLTAALAEATTPEEIASLVVRAGLAALGAHAGAVAVRSPEGTHLRVLHASDRVRHPQGTGPRRANGPVPGGADGEREYALATAVPSFLPEEIPVADASPLAEAARSGLPVHVEPGQEPGECHPLSRQRRERDGRVSLTAVPISTDGRVIGSMAFWYSENRSVSEEDEAYLAALAHQCAGALERARLYGAERLERARAENALRLRDQLLAAVAHDLRTPLTVIRGYAQLLGRQLGRLEEPDRERATLAVAQIQRETARLARWVDELGDVGRTELGRPLALRREPMDLVALAGQVVTDFQRSLHQTHQAGIHRIRLQAGTEALVGHWDRARLERVLVNLLTNAIKYSPAGGEVEVGVGKRLRPDSNSAKVTGESPDGAAAPQGWWAELVVRDRGIGIPPDDLPHIFEPFRRARNATGQMEGSGLGLANVRQIVEQHGGTVAVESELGLGTAFSITLPPGPVAGGAA